MLVNDNYAILVLSTPKQKGFFGAICFANRENKTLEIAFTREKKA